MRIGAGIVELLSKKLKVGQLCFYIRQNHNYIPQTIGIQLQILATTGTTCYCNRLQMSLNDVGEVSSIYTFSSRFPKKV